NQLSATWENFLIADPLSYRQASESERETLRKSWRDAMVRYADSPHTWEGTDEALAMLSRPHVTLLLAFLRLLRHVRTQLNDLPGQHLEYYYRKALGLTRQAAIPDHVHVVLSLADDIEQHLVTAGTPLNAGKDAEGKDLVYVTESDAVLTKARISDLRTAFVARDFLGVAAYHRRYQADETAGFERMLRIPWGQPGPGDPLPEMLSTTPALAFTEAGLFEALNLLDATETEIGMDSDVFLRMVRLAESQLDIDHHNAEWQFLRSILPFDAENEAVELFGEWVNRAFVQMQIRDALQTPPYAQALQTLDAILDPLHLSAAEFRQLMATRQAEIDEEDPEVQTDWTEIYALLDLAWVRSQQAVLRAELSDFFDENGGETQSLRFQAVVAFAFGAPGEPGEYLLPLYAGGAADLSRIHADLRATNAEVRAQAE
ncbi:MAG: hypothetical protein AAF570_25540, partial [Bacteroidota bacterium]